MKKLMSLLIVGAVLAAATSASAGEFSLFGRFYGKPAPNSPYGKFVSLQDVPPPAPATEGMQQEMKMEPQPVGLFHCVRYDDLRNIHPCAVEKIVSIKDPCWKPDPCKCGCQTAPCVLVKICVPPCGCPKVRVSRDGSRVKYDYGEYEVEISSRRGEVKVDYDD